MKTLLSNSRNIFFLLSVALTGICFVYLISLDFTGLQFKGMLLTLIASALTSISLGIGIYSKGAKE